MRTRISLIAALAAGIWAASALAASPAQIYSDYVRSGRLSCSYSRSDLEALLRSGTINQYGDPLTLARLKLAARRHLAGGCQKRNAPSVTRGGTTTSTATEQEGRSKRHAQSKQPNQPKQHSKTPSRFAAGAKPTSGGDNGSFIAGRGLIIGLLAAALAFAGWLTKRALSARG